METIEQTQSPVFQLYPILKKITSHLDPSSLFAVERLTSNWASVVARERLNRSARSVYYYIFYCMPSVEDTEDYREKRKRRRESDGSKLYSLDNCFRANIGCSDPSLILLFTETDSLLTDSLSSTISQMFTKDTLVVSIASTDGVIGTLWESKEVRESQRSSCSTQSVSDITSCLIFPRHREFGVSLLNSDHVEAPANTKLVLLFQSALPKRRAGKRVRLSHAESNQSSSQDIWYIGGITHKTHVFQSNEAKFLLCNLIGIAFHGSNLQAFNCVLPSNLVASADIEIELLRFRSEIDNKSGVVPGRCAAIACICCMRGVNMHIQEGVEGALFKKAFPEVPLAGCFTGGEISICCSKFVPLDGRISNSDLIGFSSVFVILTW